VLVSLLGYLEEMSKQLVNYDPAHSYVVHTEAYIHGINLIGLIPGTNPKWASGRFWNYVDHTLELIRKNARKTANNPAKYEKGV